MCGASLLEEEETQPEEEAGTQHKLPGIVRALIVVGLALVILSAGGFGLYSLLITEPEAEPEETTPTATATRTPTATPTATPTPTPTPTMTPTPIPPLAHPVQEGETLIDIAILYDTSMDAILALNPEVEPELIRVGQVLLIPAPTPTPGPTSTLEPGEPTPTPPDYIVHIVASGETLSTIAEDYGIPMEVIRVANELPPGDDTIFVNQSLTIPLNTPTPTLKPTMDPNATPTPVPPYPAPPLLSPPGDTTLVGGDEPILLQWASVSVLRSDEWYELAFRQTNDGPISATVRTRATAWRVPSDLIQMADRRGEEFRWWVQIVREAHDRSGALIYEKVGAPSKVRTFRIVRPMPTPTVTLSPPPTE